MLQTLEQAEGKTISKIQVVDYYSQLYILFTDDTVLLVDSCIDHDNDVELYLEKSIDLYIAKEVGLLTEEEYRAIIDRQNKEREKMFRERDYQEYLKLKERFENEN